MDDHEAIRNLLSVYCELMDAGDFDGVGELFADGVLMTEDGAEIARGCDGVSSFYASIVILHDGSPRTTHVTANPIVDVDGDRATVRSTYVVLQGVDGPPVPIVTGRYGDRFFRSGGVWRFAERRYSLGQTGDLSRHLRMTVR